jgi:hypothetical protein
MPARSLWPILSVAILACGGGGGDDRPDAGDGPDAAPLACPAAPHAFFTIWSTPESSQFQGAYSDVAWPTIVEPKQEAGDCTYFAPEPPFCDPACEGETLCATGSVCRGFPQAIDVGTVRVAGTDPELELEPTPYNTYVTSEAFPGLYQPGDELTVSLGGAGDIDALSLTVRGVPTLVVENTALTARDHEDLLVTWQPEPSSPEGTEVVFRADNDHHGIQAFILCRTADDGELVVPSAVLDLLIEAGETGIGTYIENAWLARVNRDTSDTDLGCAEFQSESQQPISIEVMRPD